MSGEMAAQALQDHFDAICRAELSRLRKKVAALSPAERAEVEALAAEIVNGIARHPARALAEDESPLLVRAVVDLFHVSA